MPLKAVCIELRPNLCSGHVFLQFDHDLGDSNKTRVVIKEHDIQITENNDAKNAVKIHLANFGMDMQQISGFVASGANISFRFNYTKIDMEALESAGGLQEEPKPRPLLLNFGEKADPMSLHCSKCLYELVTGCSYQRLREFPSGLIDPCEFFCHSHGDSSSKTTTLVPKPQDLYYGLNHIVLNAAVLHETVINAADHLYCKRCMQMLGHKILENAAIKLWADALRWLPTRVKQQTAERVERLPRQLFQHATVTQLMLRLLNQLWTHSLPQFCPGSSRALLVSTMPNRRQQYMLIQVLERQLAVLRRLCPQEQPKRTAQDLHYFRACKLYYRVFDQSLDELEQQMELPRLAISPGLFVELQRRFKRHAQLIPRPWRYNSPEEQLQLTYFFYESEQLEQHQQLHVPQPQRVVKKPEEQQLKQELEEQEKKQQEPSQELEEYETDAGLDASLDETDNEDSDDEHSDTDSDSKSQLRHKSVPIMQYEQNLVKRWLTSKEKQQQTAPDSSY